MQTQANMAILKLHRVGPEAEGNERVMQLECTRRRDLPIIEIQLSMPSKRKSQPVGR